MNKLKDNLMISVFSILLAFTGSSLLAPAAQAELCQVFPDTVALVETKTDHEFTEAYPDLPAKYQQILQMVSPHMNQPLLSIVIPAYREAQRLPDSLRKIQRFFDFYPLPIEILVVVEKSPDSTYEVARELVAGDSRIQVIDNQIQRGKGYAVRSGMQRVRGRYSLFMDADLSTPLPEIMNFLAEFQQHPELQILIGDRWDQLHQNQQSRSGFRRVLSSGFNALVNMVSVKGIADTQCGFKAFSQKAASEIFGLQQIDGFAFDVEVLVLAEELGYPIATRPVQWFDDSRSTVHPIWDPLRMARDLVRIRWQVRRQIHSRTSLVLQTTP